MLILALDLASRAGWALGRPHDAVPSFGSTRFASAGSSHEAVFAGAFQWAEMALKSWKPDRIVFEAPLPASFKRGLTNKNTTALLFGLPAVVSVAAYRQRIYDVRQATVRDVRNFMLGHNPKSHIAAKALIHRCKMLGWDVGTDADQANACALWFYCCSLIDPKLAIKPTPLFSGKPALAEELT